MKILIAYYSKTGNTKKVAEDLSKQLKVNIDEVIDLKDRSGIVGWILSGKDAAKNSLTEIKVKKNPKDYDLVIVGTPIWALNSTPAIKTYVTNFKRQFKKVAIFTTSAGSPPEKTVDYLEKILDKKVVGFTGFISEDFKENEKYKNKLEKFVEEIDKVSL